jgi:hypothetical protein
MPIAFDSSEEIFKPNNTATSHNTTFVNTAGDFMVVSVWAGFNGSIPSSLSVTYNGVSMTSLYSETASQQRYGIFYLANPATGSNTLTTTHVGGGSNVYHFGSVASYSGVDQTTPIDASPVSQAYSGTAVSDSVTTVADNAWAIMCLMDSGGGTVPTAGAGTTFREPATAGQWNGLLDSNGPVTPAGSKTLNANFSPSTPGRVWTFSIAPAVGATTPTVTTQAVSSIGETTATGNGNVTSDGGATITERGVCWNTSTAPTTANSTATAAGTTGAFTASMTGLTAGTLYYVRAYAINSEGTSYGAEVTFTTDDVPDAFTSGQWSVADLETTGDARITITALPSDNGAAITDLEVKVGAAAYASLAGTTTGTYDVAGFTDGVSTNVLIRAVNAVGNGADSDTKSVTTTAPAAFSPADTDIIYVRDVSDTTNSSTGEYKAVTLDDLKTYFNAP